MKGATMRPSYITFILLAFGLAGNAHDEMPVIRHAPAARIDPSSGEAMFREYCAVCHGLDGKGRGPAAPALRQAPGDLTLLAQKSGGPFPGFRIANILQGDAEIPAHGSREMPAWGDVFRGLGRDETIVKLRVHNLARYLASLQSAAGKP
jgi:mono/diheme cytochrome c family protein